VRFALILAVVAAVSPVTAAPKHRDDKAEPATPPPRPPIDPAAQKLLDAVEKGPDRKAAVDALIKDGGAYVDSLGSYLARPHTASIDDRRAALVAIKAQVPDKNGHFVTPERKTEKEEKADDNLDWMAGLLALDPATPGLGEVIGDDAAIRALSASKDIHAAQLLFDAAFGDETMIYRDELGRYIRKMEPYCEPALISESQGKNYDRKRYSTYQLERLDRQEPHKALESAVADEALTIAILDTFRTTHHREAVHAVWSKVNADSPRVRAAARAAWMAYVTGPPPPPAPRKKLVLPGGKLTKKEKPLWLTYRELADNELRKTSNELLQTDYQIIDPTLDDRDAEWTHEKKAEPIDLEAVTKQLFEYYDGERAKKDSESWQAAKALSDKGDLAGAAAAIDRLIVTNPDRPQRAEMAKVYFQYGKKLEADKKWAEASAAYSKAQGLDPKSPDANNALAAYHYTVGKALEAAGKDGGPDFRKAVALRPDYAPAKSAEREVENRGKPVWMLYLAGGAAAVALALLGLAMLRRRAA
jgi:tetratricopeptide (TPR) repeat protein